VSDDQAQLTLATNWIFEKIELGEWMVAKVKRRVSKPNAIQGPFDTNCSVEGLKVYRAMEQNRPQLAVDYLNKIIAKFNFADRSLPTDCKRSVAIARAFGLRAWCNWRMVRQNTEMELKRRVEMLEQVHKDAAFVYGKS
jgi:hypothetical protein